MIAKSCSSRPACYDTVSIRKHHKVTAKPIGSHLPPSTVREGHAECEEGLLILIQVLLSMHGRPLPASLCFLFVQLIIFSHGTLQEELRIKSLVQGRI